LIIVAGDVLTTARYATSGHPDSIAGPSSGDGRSRQMRPLRLGDHVAGPALPVAAVEVGRGRAKICRARVSISGLANLLVSPDFGRDVFC
jgi:hypothetical protein